MINCAKLYRIPKQVNLTKTKLVDYSKSNIQLEEIGSSVDLWLCDLLDISNKLEWTTLSSDEKHKLNQLKIKKEKFARSGSRILLREVLAQYLKIHPIDIAFIYGKEGKPKLDAKHNSTLSFNVSHSDKWIVIAVTINKPIGLDMEVEMRPIKMINSLSYRFFTLKEQKLLINSDEKKTPFLFNCLWTMKEAFLKYSGVGIFNLQNLPDLSSTIEISHGQELSFFNLGNHWICTIYLDHFQLSIVTTYSLN